MIKYDNNEKKSNIIIKNYEEYLKRKRSILKFREELNKKIKINSKRKQISIEYSKKYISD